MACHLCEVYCRAEHSRFKDLIKAFKKESPPALPRIRVEQKGAFSFAIPCQHCEEPPCVYACLSGALRKEPQTGIVTVDLEKCIGCWTCVMVCPFGAIIPDTRRKKIAKCDLCPDRKVPACVANCPNEALLYQEDKERAIR
jgi:carbon-monoxide dehydrogenase iron sulfur subunit